MRETKIVLIGAGSATFSIDTMTALFAEGDAFNGSTLTLVDIDERGLEAMTTLARRANDEFGAGLVIESSSDRRAALVGAEFVVISVELDRYPAWKRDSGIVNRGSTKSYCENGGPGGLSHGLRIIPVVVEICEDVAAIAPNATVLNYTNPMSRVCLAATRYSGARVVGLCHQIGHAYYEVGRALGWVTAPVGSPEERIEAGAVARRLELRACGLNHLTFLTQIWDRETRTDAYPLFLERLGLQPATFAPLARRVQEVFGLYPTGGDRHISEYFGWSSELADVEPDFVFSDARDVTRKTRLAAALDGTLPLRELFFRVSEFEPDRAVDIIMSMRTGEQEVELAVNVVNNGAIPGLPDWAIVEVPALVGAGAISPLQMPHLTDGLTAMLNQQIVVQDRAVEAAIRGDRRIALQAVLLDPVSGSSLAHNEALLDELLDANAGLLPRFASR